MPADLYSDEAIKKVREQVQSLPGLLDALRAVQQSGSIQNSRRLGQEMFDRLQRLAELGLVDPGYSGSAEGSPFLWVINSNGERVLRYLTGIRAGPHYEVTSPELAAWLERQGADRWWNVDGDPLLTGRLTFPCPGDELAAELRRIGRSLLIQARKDDGQANGERIDASQLDRAVSQFKEGLQVTGAMPDWADARFLYLCWKGSPHEWLLAEDLVTTQHMHDEAQMSRTK
jgi:hypothetical protein